MIYFNMLFLAVSLFYSFYTTIHRIESKKYLLFFLIFLLDQVDVGQSLHSLAFLKVSVVVICLIELNIPVMVKNVNMNSAYPEALRCNRPDVLL